MKRLLIRILPARLFLFLRGHGWYGNFDNWGDAKKLTTGFETDDVLLKVKESLLKVKSGTAVYERDSVLFDKIEYSWELLSALMWIAAQNRGTLNVIDFGGSLGSTYYQNKAFLDTIPQVFWNIVEQPHFVETGKKEFENDSLKFYFSIEECVSQNMPEVQCILFGSVLPYMEKPYELLSDIFKKKFTYIIVARTFFTKNKPDRITIQKVPKSYYDASYPCWIFNESKFIDFFHRAGYEVVYDFKEKYQINIPSDHKGFLFKLKNDYY